MISRNCRLQALALSCSALATATVQAQANPYFVGVSQSFTHESNLFRVATNQPRTSDTFGTTTLFGGIDQPFGRQRLQAELAAGYSRYKDNDQLNNTRYRASIALDWETVEKLSGRLGYTINQSLARYGADEGPTLTSRNLERSQELLALARYGRESLLAAEASFAHRQLDYSASAFAFKELRQDAIRLGLLYRPSGLLTLGAAGRYTKGKYPFAVEPSPGFFLADEFTRKDLDITALWVPTGQSTVNARLSYTKSSHDAVTTRDLSGATGAFSWDYKPTGKLSFTTTLVRDSGSESAFFELGQGRPGSIGDNSQLSTILDLRGVYEATAKIEVELGASHTERDLVRAFALPSGGASTVAGTDRLDEFRLGVSYAPTRSIKLACSIGHERRSASSAVSYPYRADIASCMGQFRLQ